MLILENGAGLNNSNAYADQAYASNYFADHLFGAAWFDLDSTTQDQALIFSSRTIDDLIEWFGFRQQSTQAMEWPRFSVFDRDRYLIPVNTIPEVIKRATCDEALYLVQNGQPQSNVLPGPTEVKVGPILLRMPSSARSAVPDVVLQSIRDLGNLKSAGAGRTGRLVR